MLAITATMLVAGASASSGFFPSSGSGSGSGSSGFSPSSVSGSGSASSGVLPSSGSGSISECQKDSFIDSCMSNFIDAGGCDKVLEMRASGNETASQDFTMEILASGDVDVACFMCDDFGYIIGERCQDAVKNSECQEESFINSCLSQFIDADVCDKATDTALSGGEIETASEGFAMELLASGDVDAKCFLCEEIGDKIVEKCQFVRNHPECQEESFINSCLSQFIDADVCDKGLDIWTSRDPSDSAFQDLAMEIAASGAVDVACFLCDDMTVNVLKECQENSECHKESFMDTCMSQLSDAVGCEKALEMSLDDFVTEILASGALDDECFMCEDIGGSFVERCKDDQMISEAIVAMTGVNVGMIAGIIVAVLAVISLILCAICLCPFCCAAAAGAAAMKALPNTGDQLV